MNAKKNAAPGLQGYRMPAEWAKHEATWMAFPHHRTDWPKKLAAMPYVFAEAARIITQGERLRLLVADASERDRAAAIYECAGVNMENMDFVLHDTNRSWLRDSMPLWVKKGRQPQVAVNFRFDGWSRYRDHKKDDAAGRHVARKFAAGLFEPSAAGERFVLEGGSIDVDEFGTLLTTEECLLSSVRARYKNWGREEVEVLLAETLGVKKVLWAPTGIVGDDTSGHIDDFARFAPGGKLLVCSESNKKDENFAPLRAAHQALRGATNAQGDALEIVSLPMPDPVYYNGDRLPASYANYYICNAAVIVPVFNDRHDAEAISIIQQCYPDRPAIGVYARDLVVGLGTWHCSTMQQPA